MPSHYPRPYKAGEIEPIVDPGQQVLLVDREAYNLYRVAFIEPIPMSAPFVVDIVTMSTPALANLGSLVTANIFNTTNVLDMNYGQFAQFRCYVMDDIAVTIKQPVATSRFTTKNIGATVTPFGALMDPSHHLTEFYILEDDRIFLQVTNPTRYALARARIAFYGFRYILEGGEMAMSQGKIAASRRFANIGEAVKSGEKFTVAPIGAWGR